MSQQSPTQIAREILAYVCLFRTAPESRRPGATAVRSQLLELLDRMAKTAQAYHMPAADIEEARFAICAFADETLLASDWGGVDQWRREPLQLVLFRTNKAGNEFYDRLARLAPTQIDAREIYFLCLALGFQGEYVSDPGRRTEVLRHCYEALRAAGHAIDPMAQAQLAPPAYDWEFVPQSGPGRRVWPRLVLMGACVLVLWLLYCGLLRYQASGMPAPGGL
jgi:type VI secretion system protein ImpK